MRCSFACYIGKFSRYIARFRVVIIWCSLSREIPRYNYPLFVTDICNKLKFIHKIFIKGWLKKFCSWYHEVRYVRVVSWDSALYPWFVMYVTYYSSFNYLSDGWFHKICSFIRVHYNDMRLHFQGRQNSCIFWKEKGLHRIVLFV